MKAVRRIKAVVVFILLLSLAAGLCACSGANNGAALPPRDEAPQRVVALSSSLAEIWLLAGGSLIGTTSDTLEREFDGLSEAVAVVGTVKEPSLEAILELEPDFVILSADIAGHAALGQALLDADIPHYYTHVETFSDYYSTLEAFCGITGNARLLEENGSSVQERIDRLLERYEPANPPIAYLLLRVHSSGGKVIAEDHVACDILNDLGAANIADQDRSLLSNLSLEAILESDPDIIFVVTMGEEEAALRTLEQMFEIQPVWGRLHAVRENRVHILSKELFHYKPNAKWGEAYEALAELLKL